MPAMDAPLEDRKPAPRFAVSFATTPAEVLETQRLRYRIFAGELGAHIEGGAAGVDQDEYDAYCRHLLVRELDSGQIVACTRILTDDQAALAGGFYSAGEFDLSMIDSLPGRVMEIGRTCVHADYRSGAVIATLWQGLAGFFTRHGFDYMFGCASIGLEDGGAQAHAILRQIQAKYMAPEYHRVRPYYTLPAADGHTPEKVKMPPLLKAYVSLGAKACGDAYWDRDFNCADVFMLLNVSELCPRYARHFLGHGDTETAAVPVIGHA
jgi:putative hemolysin